jgi:hypothetical protein
VCIHCTAPGFCFISRSLTERLIHAVNAASRSQAIQRSPNSYSHINVSSPSESSIDSEADLWDRFFNSGVVYCGLRRPFFDATGMRRHPRRTNHRYGWPLDAPSVGSTRIGTFLVGGIRIARRFQLIQVVWKCASSPAQRPSRPASRQMNRAWKSCGSGRAEHVSSRSSNCQSVGTSS